MPTPRELRRRCPFCSAYPAPFALVGSRFTTTNMDGGQRSWSAAECPSCGGVIVLELWATDERIIAAYPDMIGDWQVDHLPPQVEPLWTEAAAVYGGQHFRSAVVQCGAALEAAFSSRGIKGTSLDARVRSAADKGLLTADLLPAVKFARVLRNVGAHGGRDVPSVSPEEARAAMRFTQQTLRLLFEVPGELAKLTEESEPAPPETAPAG